LLFKNTNPIKARFFKHFQYHTREIGGK